MHAGFPNYPSGRVQAPYRNRPLLRETGPAGERVVRSAVLPTPNRGFAPRLANHTAFAVSCVATAGFTGPQDVVVVESPPLFTAGAGVAYAKLKRAPLVAHVSDLWPSTAIELGALNNERAVAAARALERTVYRSAAAITVPTEGMVEQLSAEPTAAGKVRRMPPVVDVESFPALEPEPLQGPLRVLYAGTVGLAQGIEMLVDAAALAGPDVVEVTIAGWGGEGELVRERVAQRGAGNVELLGTVPAHAIPALYQRAHAGVVLLKDRPILAGALPTKMYECMASARPVILSARGEAARLIESSGAGLVAVPEDAEALAAAFRQARDAGAAALAQQGRSGREHVVAQASLGASVERWQQLFAQLV